MRETHAGAPISVVVPAYNAAAFLTETLASIARQTVRPAEIIVVDDASTDGTGLCAAALGARVLRLEHNGGPSAARNAGVRAARSPWIAFLDADDAWTDDKLERQWAALQRWPNAAFAISDYAVRRPDGSLTPTTLAADPIYRSMTASARTGDAARFAPQQFLPAFVRSMFVRQSSAVVNRAAFLAGGGYDEGMRLGEDYELFLRLGAEAPVVAIERPLVTYRRRADSLSADTIAEIQSIDTLWDTILSNPYRYSATTIAAVRAARVPTLHRGVIRSLRIGRASEARVLAAKALRLQGSPASAILVLLSALLENPAGRHAMRLARSAWRARHALPI